MKAYEKMAIKFEEVFIMQSNVDPSKSYIVQSYEAGFKAARERCASLVESIGNKNLSILVKVVGDRDPEKESE